VPDQLLSLKPGLRASSFGARARQRTHVVIKVLSNDDYSRLARIGAKGSDVPIALKDACKDVFNGAISVATLMAEHRRGNLVIYKIGRQYFTTLNELNAMMEKCRMQSPPPVVLGRGRTEAEKQRHLELAQIHAISQNAQLRTQLRKRRTSDD
jgi:hypothetical protein